MSDRTEVTAQVTLDAEPTDAERARFAEVLDEHIVNDADAGHESTLCAYMEQVRLGGGQEIAEALWEAFPEAEEVEVWEDPAYEYLGMLYRRHRGETEWFTAESDADGNATLTAPEALALLAECGRTDREFEEAVMSKLGISHSDVNEAVAKLNQDAQRAP